MNKLEILKKLLNKKIIKISKEGNESNGERTYYSGYFKLDNELNIYSYACHFSIGKNFDKRNDFTIDSLLEHISKLQAEGFILEFLSQKDFDGKD